MRIVAQEDSDSLCHECVGDPNLPLIRMSGFEHLARVPERLGWADIVEKDAFCCPAAEAVIHFA